MTLPDQSIGGGPRSYVLRSERDDALAEVRRLRTQLADAEEAFVEVERAGMRAYRERDEAREHGDRLAELLRRARPRLLSHLLRPADAALAAYDEWKGRDV